MNFCEAINCPGKSLYFLKDFYCYRKEDEGVPIICAFLDDKGKARVIANYYPDAPRTEIQIIAALVKSRNGK